MAHIEHEKRLFKGRAACPMCKRRVRSGDVWRLFVANEEEANGSPSVLRRVSELARERSVEARALEVARGRAERAEAALAALLEVSAAAPACTLLVSTGECKPPPVHGISAALAPFRLPAATASEASMHTGGGV